MRPFCFIIVLLLSSIISSSQNLQQYIDRVDDIASEVSSKIYNSNECEEMINDLDDLSDEIAKVLEEDDEIHPDDIKNLKDAKANAEALEAFLRCVGTSSYMAGYLKEKELNLVREMIDFSIAQVYNNRFCINIYEIKFGSYISLVAFKKGGNDILKIKAKIKSKGGSSISTMDMGLISNQYRRIWSNAGQLSNRTYVVLSVECEVTGQNNFGF